MRGNNEPTTEDGIYREIAAWMKEAHPDTIWFFDMSGVRVHPGTRAKIQHLRSGRGIPDLVILEPRADAHGLLIEIKKAGAGPYLKDGTLRADVHIREQWDMLDRLKNRGYVANFATGLAEAKYIIDFYLQKP